MQDPAGLMDKTVEATVADRRQVTFVLCGLQAALKRPQPPQKQMPMPMPTHNKRDSPACHRSVQGF